MHERAGALRRDGSHDRPDAHLPAARRGALRSAALEQRQRGDAVGVGEDGRGLPVDLHDPRPRLLKALRQIRRHLGGEPDALRDLREGHVVRAGLPFHMRPRGSRRREQPRGEDRVELHLEERRRLLEGPVRAVALESKNEALRRIHPEPQGGPAWTLALDVEHEGPAPRHLVGGTDAHVVVVPDMGKQGLGEPLLVRRGRGPRHEAVLGWDVFDRLPAIDDHDAPGLGAGRQVLEPGRIRGLVVDADLGRFDAAAPERDGLGARITDPPRSGRAGPEPGQREIGGSGGGPPGGQERPQETGRQHQHRQDSRLAEDPQGHVTGSAVPEGQRRRMCWSPHRPAAGRRRA